jgi:hypothetical protein
MPYPSLPYGQPRLKRPYNHFTGGRPQGRCPWPSYYSLGYPTPYASGLLYMPFCKSFFQIPFLEFHHLLPIHERRSHEASLIQSRAFPSDLRCRIFPEKIGTVKIAPKLAPKLTPYGHPPADWSVKRVWAKVTIDLHSYSFLPRK